MGNQLSQFKSRSLNVAQSEPTHKAAAEALLGKLPAELALKCIDAISHPQDLLALSQVNRATRAFVVDTPAYQSFINTHQGAMLTQALRRSMRLTPLAGLPSALEVHLHQLPIKSRTAAHARKILGSAAALETLTLDVHWLDAPYARVLLGGVMQSNTLKNVRVVQHLDSPHRPLNVWDHENISAQQLQSLMNLTGALARKPQATLTLDAPIGALAIKSLFGQDQKSHNTLTAVAFSLPAQFGLANVAALAASLAQWPRLEQVRLDPGLNVNRKDLGLPKLEAFLDAMAAGWRLQLLDVSGFGDLKNSALAAVEQRLGTLSHVGTIRCPVSNALQALPSLGVPLAAMGEESDALRGPRIEYTSYQSF